MRQSRSQTVPETPYEFLQLHPNMRELVCEAETKLVAYFSRDCKGGLGAVGKDVEVTQRLSLHRDDPEACPVLLVVAQVVCSPEAALEAMDRLDEEWWFDQFPRHEGNVEIRFEHRVNSRV